MLNILDILDIELHTFSDGSEETFAAVIYLRIIYPDKQPNIKFIIEKTISVAKLELQAALLGARFL